MSGPAQPVLIMAGGTGGHIFPGLAVADSLRRRGVPIHWLGARGGMECQQVSAAGIPLDVVDVSALRGKGPLRWLTGPLMLLRAVAQSSSVLGQRRPACAISFGGYAAGPGGLAARLRGIPLLVHEQNRVPGLTNRVLAGFAAKVLQAFPGTWDERKDPVTCGNPVRDAVAAIEDPSSRLAGRQGRLRLLVTGGSQGARALNRLVPQALARLAGHPPLEVRHQCGRSWAAETRQAYDAAAVPAQVLEFIEDMADAYAWADLAICRAGALTVSEVAAAGLAAVFVPFPRAVDDHQTRNARFLVERGAAVLLPEAELDARILADSLQDLLGDRQKLLDMACRARSVATPDAAERVAGLCEEFTAS
jgi:UDP-N-acetylglucosamine--N-acetylmuramyl-(pentapeptide) pyrophosphoryl-undecaprenol N-acetylglucosamine transferase